MATALIVAAILIGVAACPLIAVIQRRRGRAGCFPPSRSQVPGDGESLAELKADRARVEDRIGVLEREASSAGRVPR
ncbi:MAG: hypothetical protein AB7V58_03925 [Solirubrobacterales bacterium]